MMGWFDGCCGFGGFGSLGTLGLILNFVVIFGFVIGTILLILWLVRRISANGAGVRSRLKKEGEDFSSREILDLRYAQGDIDREQYLQMLTDLS